MSGWTAAMCTNCWVMENPDRIPTRVIEAELERCHNCGRFTSSGIYIRKNPTLQAYPTDREDD